MSRYSGTDVSFLSHLHPILRRTGTTCKGLGPQVDTVDENLKQLFQQLGEAMNQSLANSEEVANVIGQIKSSGYDVFLAFEATIGFSKHDEEPASGKLGPTLVSAGREPEFKVSQQDERFLKSLRIRLDDAA